MFLEWFFVLPIFTRDLVHRFLCLLDPVHRYLLEVYPIWPMRFTPDPINRHLTCSRSMLFDRHLCTQTSSIRSPSPNKSSPARTLSYLAAASTRKQVRDFEWLAIARFALNKFEILIRPCFPHIFNRTRSLHEFLSQPQCALSIATFIGKVLEHQESLLTNVLREM